jgi:micrococcal nuclease
MNKKRGILFGIALMLLFTEISASSSDVEIYAFDQNPAGMDEGNEWVTLYNPSNQSVDIGNWTLETADGERETIPEGTTLYPGAYYIYAPPCQWLDNTDEAITLRDAKGEEVDKTAVRSDKYNDNLCWMREGSRWVFGIKELEKGKIRRGLVKNVHDGDTIDISFGIYGIRRIRLVGVNTPELGTQGGEEAKEFVNKTCLLEVIEFDVDDEKQYDPYCRILAVIYMNGTNLNKELLRKEYAEIMYIPPSELNPYEWIADYPSILGTFIGTIERFYNDLIVHRVYTPSCEGTGGHSEHIAFYHPDGTELANATWNGYSGEYHWIEFDEPIKLKKNVNYTYEIKTGSYPKYIHNHTLKTSREEITCLEFVDANGKKYDNWIPAIKLE